MTTVMPTPVVQLTIEPVDRLAWPYDGRFVHVDRKLTATISGRTLVALASERPVGSFLYRTERDDDGRTMTVEFFGRECEDSGEDDPPPPWERFVVRVPVREAPIDHGGIEFGEPELIEHEVTGGQAA